MRVRLKYRLASCVGTWRSLVARLLWEQDVAGSNPVVPTISSLFPTQKSCQVERARAIRTCMAGERASGAFGPERSGSVARGQPERRSRAGPNPVVPTISSLFPTQKPCQVERARAIRTCMAGGRYILTPRTTSPAPTKTMASPSKNPTLAMTDVGLKMHSTPRMTIRTPRPSRATQLTAVGPAPI